jgi:TRAP-type C4-dicarboxylate transport system permease small subunit
MNPAPPAEAGPAATAAASPLLARGVRAVDTLNEALLALLAVTLGLLALLAFLQVIARYVIGAPLTWSEEVIRYALIWSVFLGVGICIRRGMLASVEIINAALPPLPARLLRGASLTVSAAFWVVMISYGWIILGNVEGMLSGALELPMTYVYLAIPVGSLLALVNTLAIAVSPPRAGAEMPVD